jgi:hypothetical protein
MFTEYTRKLTHCLVEIDEERIPELADRQKCISTKKEENRPTTTKTNQA